MKYLSLLLMWCFASMVAIAVEVIFFEYSISFMVHFFIGIFLILIFGMREAILKDRERNRLLTEHSKKEAYTK